MNKNTYCVYMHKNKINGKIYVGSTKYGDDPNKRWRDGEGYGGEFKNDIDKYGWDNFEHHVIQNNLSLEEANELEKLNIITFNTTDPKYGYNKYIVGNIFDEQSAQKLSESLSKVLQGHKVSEETKQKISVANKGIAKSKEHREKLSKSLKGRTPWNKGIICSEETKQKISDSLKGKPLSEETKRKLSKIRKDLVYVHKDCIEKRVNFNEVDKYLSLGYTKGRIPKAWIHRDNIVKFIDLKDLDYYMSLGFVKGRK